MDTGQFVPHPRILRTLIGSNIYADRSVPLRELVQNARDAVMWRQQLTGGQQGGLITVSYSIESSWLEVADDGVGMNERDVRESLLKVGSDKYEALGLDPATEQIALFGIGFLSVFLVADRVTLWTKKENGAGLRVEISGIDEPVHLTPDDSVQAVGTRVRVVLRPESFNPAAVPEALRKFARHVDNLRLVNAATGESEPIDETWATTGLWSVSEVAADEAIRAGRVGFAEGLRAPATISNRFVLCNAGFLVEERALDLVQLPPSAGISGELDLHPAALNIVMARERFQRDAEWEALGFRLRQMFVEHASGELQGGALARKPGPDEGEVRRTILIWDALIPDEPDLLALKENLRERIWTTVPFTLSELGPRTLEAVSAKLPEKRIYIRRLAAPTRSTRSVDDEGSPVQFMEEIRFSVRVGALRARGFEVVEAGQLRVTLENKQSASDSVVEEEAAIRRAADSRGFEVRDIAQALPEDMNLDAIEVLPVLHGFLELAGGLRFAHIPESQRRVVADPSGIHYLNVDAPSVGRLLQSIPDAVANPLKRRLLSAYLAMEDYDIASARRAILDLLESPELADLASANVAPLTQEYIRSAVSALASK